MLKILHTGDIHLDSPFARLDARRAEERRAEARASFSAAMQYARANDIDLVLIAGDVVDREYVTRETVEHMTREFSRLSCPVVIAPGNHDFFGEGSIWQRVAFPENVHVFREETLTRLTFDELGCDVYGYAFTSPEMTDCPIASAHVADPSRINLLCAHGDTASPISRYAPLPPSAVCAFGADYAALGHIHNPGAIESRDGTVIAYCGCLEARAPDETGIKGAIVAEIAKENGRARVRAGRVRFSRRRYENDTLDITGADSLGDIENRIRSLVAAQSYGTDTLLRLTLSGTTPPALVVDTDALSGRFPELYSVEIEDGTSPALTAADFEGDRTVRGAFYRALLPRLESADAEERRLAVLALRAGLAAIAGENIGGV